MIPRSCVCLVLGLHRDRGVGAAEQIRDKWDVCRIAMAHRLGIVEVEEPSVIIAISSVHRRDSLEAVQYAIDTLKATVPIWKMVSVRIARPRADEIKKGRGAITPTFFVLSVTLLCGPRLL